MRKKKENYNKINQNDHNAVMQFTTDEFMSFSGVTPLTPIFFLKVHTPPPPPPHIHKTKPKNFWIRP